MNVTLREKKISNGERISLYLDIYHSKERRWKEFLDIQLITKPKNSIEREKNKELRKLAEMVCAKRLIGIKSNTNGITPTQRVKADFMKYFDSLVEKRRKTGINCNAWISTKKHLHEFLPMFNVKP